MKTLLPLLAAALLCAPIHAADDTPVPPEVQKIVETMIAALKGSDDAALRGCWHAPEVAAKADPTEEAEKEIKKQRKNLDVSSARADQVRTFISKHFGEISGLTLDHVELDVDEEAPAEMPRYDNVKIYVRTGDGTHLRIEVDDAVKIDGVWKFLGRLDDDLTIELPDVD